MKRLLPLLLIGLLLFIGCGGDTAEQPIDTAPTEAATKVLTFAKPAPPPEDLSAEIIGLEVLLTWTPLNPGDYNSDGVVNGLDVFRIASRFGQHSNYNGHTADEPDNDCIDGTKDGTINGLDLFLVSTNFEKTIDGFNVFERKDGDRDPTQLNDTLVEFVPPNPPECVETHSYTDTETSEGTWNYSITVRQGISGESDPTEEVEIEIIYTIPPAPPKGFVASDAGYDGAVRLWWDDTQLADGYKVYRSDSVGGVYTYLSDANSPPIWDGSRYDDETAAEGTTYWYKVTAYNEHGEGEMSEPDSGFWDSDVLIPPVPENLNVSLDQYEGYIICDWDASIGADNYHLYRSTDPEETGEKIFENINQLYVDFPPELETSYYYRVSAANDVGESNVTSAQHGRALAFTSTGELADTPWPTFRHDLQGTSSSDIWGPADEVPAMDLFIDLPTDSTITVTPIINLDGNLIVTTDDAMYEVTLPGGAIINTIPVVGGKVAPLITDSGTLYQVDSTQYLRSFLPGIWVEAWNRPLGGNGSALNILANDTGNVFTTVDDGVESVGSIGYTRGGGDLWDQTLVRTGTSALAFSADQNIIYVGDSSRRLYALDAADGSVLSGWPANMLADTGSVSYVSPPVVYPQGSGERVLVCNGSGLLYSFDPFGEMIFSQGMHGIGSEIGPVFSDNTAEEDKRIVVICNSDPEDSPTFRVFGYTREGAEFWKNPNVVPRDGRVVNQPVVCAGPDERDYILFGTLGGTYYCIDVIDGSDQWDTNFGDTGPPATGGFCLNSDGNIYFGSTEGRLFKLSSTPL